MCNACCTFAPLIPGNIKLHYCEQILLLAEQGKQAVHASHCQQPQCLHVAVDSELTWRWMTHVLNGFLQQYPDICMSVDILDPAQIATTDTPIAVDCWIAADIKHMQGLQPVMLAQWPRHLYASSQPQMPCRDLPHPQFATVCPWLRLRGTQSLRIRLHHDHSPQILELLPTEPRIQAASYHMLADHVAVGLGIAILPDWIALCPQLGLKGRIQQILPAWQAEPVTIWMHIPVRPRTAGAALLTAYLLGNISVLKNQ